MWLCYRFSSFIFTTLAYDCSCQHHSFRNESGFGLFVFLFRYKAMKDLKDKIHTRFTDLMELASGYGILLHL